MGQDEQGSGTVERSGPLLAGSGSLAHVGLDQARQVSEISLSVVLPNYNHGQYLSRAIDAIAGQDRPPDEIIVIEDGSSDNSRDVLIQCQRQHPGLIVLINEINLGTLLALQRGLEVAKGRYIYFAAADDLVLPGFFSQAIHTLEANPTVGLFCAETVLLEGEKGLKIGTRPVVRPSRRAGIVSAKDVENLLRRADNFIHTGSSLFRRQTLLIKGGFLVEAGSFSDGLLARKIALTTGMWFWPKAAAIWQIHSGGLSRATALDRDRAVDALVTIPRLIRADADFPPWYAELFQRRWRFGSARLALDVKPPDKTLLAAMAPDTWVDHAVIAVLSAFLQFRAARFATLAWLTLRLRPYRLTDLAVTALDRWTEGGAVSDGSWPDELQARKEPE